MKVHTKVVIDIASEQVLEDEFYEYEGPVAQALGPVLGAALGGIASGLAGSLFGGGQSGSATTTQRVQIPDFLRPLLEQQTGVSEDALSSLTELLQGQTVAGFNPDQLSALNLGRARAMGAGGFFPTAQQEFLSTAQGEGGLPGFSAAGLEQLQETASGDFLSQPGFQAAFESALRQAQPEISGAFSLAGRTGSGLAQTAQTQAAADAFARLFNAERARQVGAGSTLAGLGSAERSRQLEAARLLPQLGVADVNLLQQIGEIQQEQEQREILGPILAMQQLMQASGGPVSLGSLLGANVSQPVFSNPLAGILGGAAIGSQLFAGGGNPFQITPASSFTFTPNVTSSLGPIPSSNLSSNLFG